MSADPPVFVDTNVLFYSLDPEAGPRHVRAREVIEHLLESRTGAISTQVLSELSVNLRQKGGLSWNRIAGLLDAYLAWPVVSIEPLDPLEAVRIAKVHKLSYWDGLIIRAATKIHAPVLLTEDLTHGQLVEGVEIVDPFQAVRRSD